MLKGIFERLLNVGVEKTKEENYNWLRNSNGIALVILMLSVVYFIVFYFFGVNHLLLLPTWAMFSSIGLFIFNFYGLSLIGRHLLFYSVFGCSFLSCLYLGEKSGFQYSLVLIATLPLIIFPSKQYAHWIPGVLLSAIGMVALKTGLFLQHQIVSNEIAEVLSYLSSATLFVWIVVFFAKFAFKSDTINGEWIAKAGNLLKDQKQVKHRYNQLNKKHIGATEQLIALETEKLILGNEVKQYIKRVESIIAETSDPEKIQAKSKLSLLLQEMKANSDWSREIGLEHINTQYIVEDILTDIKRHNREIKSLFVFENLPVIEAKWEDFKALMVNLIRDAIKRAELFKEGTIRITCDESEKNYQFSIYVTNPEIDGERVLVNEEEQHAFYLKPSNTGICNKIVESYDGKLWVNYDLEEGFSVHFTIAKQQI